MPKKRLLINMVYLTNAIVDFVVGYACVKKHKIIVNKEMSTMIVANK